MEKLLNKKAQRRSPKNQNGIYIKVKKHEVDWKSVAEFSCEYFEQEIKKLEDKLRKERNRPSFAKGVLLGGLIVGLIWIISLI